MPKRKQSNPHVSPFITVPNPPISGFLGIGEGKNKQAKAALITSQSSADALQKATDALSKIASLEAQSKIDAAKLLQSQQDLKAIQEENATKSGSKTFYIIGGIVAVMMIGIYFIVKARRK